MINEDQLEQLAIQWCRDTGWSFTHGPDIAPESAAPVRSDFREVVPKGRLASAISRLYPKLPPAAVEEVIQLATKPSEPSLAQNNRAFHRRTIAQHRDTLLPQLLSGELTVPEVESQTEEALA